MAGMVTPKMVFSNTNFIHIQIANAQFEGALEVRKALNPGKAHAEVLTEIYHFWLGAPWYAKVHFETATVGIHVTLTAEQLSFKYNTNSHS